MAIKVILVDDHAVVREGLKLILNATKDIRVVGEATNGEQAVELATAQEPDVVLMDISMDTMDGIAATWHLCLRVPSVKVVVLTMHIEEEYVRQALKAGAAGYLLKESAGQEVITAVRAVVTGERYLSHRVAEIVTDAYVSDGRQLGPFARVSRLTVRERQIVQGVVEGKSSAEIGRELDLSRKTVDSYRSRVLQKLDVPNTAALVRFAVEHGLGDR